MAFNADEYISVIVEQIGANFTEFQTKAEANQAIFEYIEVFYNRQRIHSANDNLSPVEFEEKMLLNEQVA